MLTTAIDPFGRPPRGVDEDVMSLPGIPWTCTGPHLQEVAVAVALPHLVRQRDALVEHLRLLRVARVHLAQEGKVCLARLGRRNRAGNALRIVVYDFAFWNTKESSQVFNGTHSWYGSAIFPLRNSH